MRKDAAAAPAVPFPAYQGSVECPNGTSPLNYDVVVYGATAGGVIAAVSAARQASNASVLLMAEGLHLGGMVASGLGHTDGTASGGTAAEFFERVGGYDFAPSAAERVFEAMVANESNLHVVRNCPIDAASTAAGRISSVSTSSGGAVAAAAFVDATYEGDLLAAAGARFAVGRESRDAYGEAAAGRLPAPPSWGCGCNWQWPGVNGTDASGALLPFVTARAPLPPLGSGDDLVQDYNFRLCLTRNASNRRAIPVPPAYDPARWELLRRVFGTAAGKASKLGDFLTISDVGAGKTDVNNGGGFSTDFVGASSAWPNASRAERARIFEQHRDYTLGLLHFLRSDPSVPAAVAGAMAQYGLCADEFVDTGGWPHQLYVREARRLVGDWVFTQHDRVTNTSKADSIATGGYNIDAHMTQRVLLADGTVTNEGCLSGWARSAGVSLRRFEIPYRVLLPRRRDVTNLLVAVAVSASHVGYGSLRLEPQYMNMGEAAGVAAVMSLRGSSRSVDVQDVPVAALQAALVARGVVIRK